MPSIDRTTIITGPALVTYGGQTFWSKGNIVLKPVFARFAIQTASFGKVDERFVDRRFTITFEPSGRFNDLLAAVLWPYGGTTLGTSIIGASDKALVIHGRDGVKLTFHNAAITAMPSLRVAVNQTAVGPITFTAICAKNTDPTNAAAYYTIASQAYPGDSGFAVADIPTAASDAAWGVTPPWDAFHTEAGWDISFNMGVQDMTVDGLGTQDLLLTSLDVSAKAAIVGPTVAQVLTALKPTQAFGTSLAGDNLVISGQFWGAPNISIANAALVDAECRWGATDKRIGTCEWIATRSITAGTPDPLFTVAAIV